VYESGVHNGKSGRKGKEHATTTQKTKNSKRSHGSPVTIFGL